MKTILAQTLMIVGAVLISGAAICLTVAKANSLGAGNGELFLFLIGGIIILSCGFILFLFEMKKK